MLLQNILRKHVYREHYQNDPYFISHDAGNHTGKLPTLLSVYHCIELDQQHTALKCYVKFLSAEVTANLYSSTGFKVGQDQFLILTHGIVVGIQIQFWIGLRSVLPH